MPCSSMHNQDLFVRFAVGCAVIGVGVFFSGKRRIKMNHCNVFKSSTLCLNAHCCAIPIIVPYVKLYELISFRFQKKSVLTSRILKTCA